MTRNTVLFLIVGSISTLSSATDFGVRQLGAPIGRRVQATHGQAPFTLGPTDVHAASQVGARYGRITSIFRSAAHNRAVGGVANSYHLQGRAIDIARRPGVTHRQIDAALRQAGYQLIESLDEGDHSHFAFAGSGQGARRAAAPVTTAQLTELTRWGIVYAPR